MYLNTHSYFSLRYGTLAIGKLIELAKQNNIKALTLASYLSMLFLGISNAFVGATARNIDLTPFQIGLFLTIQNIGFMVVSIPRRDQVSGQFPAEKYNQRLSYGPFAIYLHPGPRQ